jgi:hypothetical protein
MVFLKMLIASAVMPTDISGPLTGGPHCDNGALIGADAVAQNRFRTAGE